jgi:hypothetical protein
MTKAEEFFRKIYLGESDGAATISGAGSKRQTKSGGTKTPVDQSPQTKVDAKLAYDGPGSKEGVGKSYTKETDPVRNRQSQINFAPNPNPSTPTQRPPTPMDRVKGMWEKSILDNTKRMQKLQRPGQK